MIKIILLGDFNLDENKRYINNYSHKQYFEDLNDTVDPFGMIQFVDFNTWSRLVSGVWRFSSLRLAAVLRRRSIMICNV